MPSFLFWLLSAVMLIGGISVVAFRNPVSSALSVVTCFVGLAGLLIGLSAFFVGVIQILVYTGAVMVLFLFIIMLLDLKNEEHRVNKMMPIAAGIFLTIAFIIQLVGVLSSPLPHQTAPFLDAKSLAVAGIELVREGKIPADGKISTALQSGHLPDVHFIGHSLFTNYNFPLQILGVILLVATIGVVALTKRTEE